MRLQFRRIQIHRPALRSMRSRYVLPLLTLPEHWRYAAYSHERLTQHTRYDTRNATLTQFDTYKPTATIPRHKNKRGKLSTQVRHSVHATQPLPVSFDPDALKNARRRITQRLPRRQLVTRTRGRRNFFLGGLTQLNAIRATQHDTLRKRETDFFRYSLDHTHRELHSTLRTHTIPTDTDSTRRNRHIPNTRGDLNAPQRDIHRTCRNAALTVRQRSYKPSVQTQPMKCRGKTHATLCDATR